MDCKSRKDLSLLTVSGDRKTRNIKSKENDRGRWKEGQVSIKLIIEMTKSAMKSFARCHFILLNSQKQSTLIKLFLQQYCSKCSGDSGYCTPLCCMTWTVYSKFLTAGLET